MRGRFTTLGILLMALVMTATACSSVAESPMQSLSFEVMNSVVAESQYEGVTGTVNAAEPTSVQMQIREMQEIPEGNHYQEFVAQYIKDHAVAVGSAVSVPVYYEEQILYSMECFAIGQDAGLTVTSSNRHSFFENMVTLFPDPVLREIGDYVYICYDTENDTRLYVFYSKEKDGGMYTDGFPIIMKKTLSYADFAGLKPGDGIEKVEAIDPVVPLYMPTFNLDRKSVV